MKIVTKFKKGKNGQDVFNGSLVIGDIPSASQTPIRVNPPAHLEKTPIIEKVYAEYQKNLEKNKLYEGQSFAKTKEELAQLEELKDLAARQTVINNFVSMGFSEDEINEIVIEKNPKRDYSDRARDIYDYSYSIKFKDYLNILS
jgi:hypothetical protein